MNDEYNELNDIILNRNEKSDARKKMLIGIGALAVVAITIVIIMGRLSSTSQSQLPQPNLPTVPTAPVQSAAPETTTPPQATPVETPEDAAAQQQLDAVVDKVKPAADTKPVPLDQSEVIVVDEQSAPAPASVKEEPKPVPTEEHTVTEVKTVQTPKPAPVQSAHPASGDIYIQVGSFSRYKPNDAFLRSIKRNGYTYTLHRVVMNGQITNKVLVGPFKDRSDAKTHLTDVRRKIESGAFIYTIK